MLFGQEFVRRMQTANLMRLDLDPEMTAYVMGVISFGLLSIGRLAPTVQMPALATLAESLADLVERGFGTGDQHATKAGKEAFRILVRATRDLYAERMEFRNGHRG